MLIRSFSALCSPASLCFTQPKFGLEMTFRSSFAILSLLMHWMLRGLKLPTALAYPGSKEAVTLDVHRTDDGKVQLQAKTGGG